MTRVNVPQNVSERVTERWRKAVCHGRRAGLWGASYRQSDSESDCATTCGRGIHRRQRRWSVRRRCLQRSTALCMPLVETCTSCAIPHGLLPIKRPILNPNLAAHSPASLTTSPLIAHNEDLHHSPHPILPQQRLRELATCQRIHQRANLLHTRLFSILVNPNLLPCHRRLHDLSR